MPKSVENLIFVKIFIRANHLERLDPDPQGRSEGKLVVALLLLQLVEVASFSLHCDECVGRVQVRDGALKWKVLTDVNRQS